jgi:hypothetical protein
MSQTRFQRGDRVRLMDGSGRRGVVKGRCDYDPQVLIVSFGGVEEDWHELWFEAA